ncbi:MAG TPA: universal stress protein [Ktedonobacteraceae bacterium]|nr:universal stress protein [Ktedonobacteraceae bacterium]
MFKNILVPLDGSARAESALPIAARIARASGGSVMLVHVVTIPVMYGTSMSASYTADLVEAEINYMGEYLKALAHSDVLAGIKTETSALFGAEAQTLLSVATSYTVDLIVMTSQGKTGMKRWALGSVAQKVARHSSMPVLVLHEAGAMLLGPRPDGGPVRALVTLDGSALAKAALEPAAQAVAALAAPGHGALHLLRVVKPPQLDEKKIDPDRLAVLKSEALHKARTYMHSIVTHLREGPMGALHLAVTWSVVLDDDIAGTIIHVAENGEDTEGAGVPGRCDLIAMATHGRTGFQHWVLGSITERVLGATRLPILIVRPAETEFHRAGNGSVTFAEVETV